MKKTTTKADNKPILSRKKAIQSNGQGVVPPPPEVKVESPVVAPEPKVKRTRAKKATEKEEHRSSPPAVSNKTARKKDEEYSEEKYSRSPEEEEEDFFVEPVKPRAKSPRTSSGFDDDDLLDVFEDDVPLDEDEIIPDALELDPLDVPLELLDPDLIETPRHTAPPKPKPVVRTERRQVKCDGCGQMFGWLSVERLCFSCLKKKIAARKREDEGYSSGFGSGGSSSDADEDDGDA